MAIMHSPPNAETQIDGRRYVYFCGTSYHGLHGHPQVVEAACEATRRFGLGSATTRAGFGNTLPTLEVEQQAAEYFETESAFYFASGYVGNQILVSALSEAAHVVFVDAASHYSVIDASRLSALPVQFFAHASAESLQAKLRDHLRPGQVPLVLSDGVFAARGTIAPVRDYCEVLRHYPHAMLCLDDCHAFGVLGEHGQGTFEQVGLHGCGANGEAVRGAFGPDLPELYCVGTLSKAFGGYGGILCGSGAFLERARTRSHYYSGASTPPTPAAAASTMGLRIVAAHPEMIARLQANAHSLRQGLRGLGLDVPDSPVPIIALELGDSANMQRIQRALADEGILIAYMAAYAGLGPEGILRIAVFSTHTDEMLEQLTRAIERNL